MPAAVTPLTPSFLASLAQYESYDATPVIGTVFPNKSTQLSEFLEASNADELIHDLAVLVSHRGVVFFKDQDITIEQQKALGQRLGELTGKPATSKLHRHPISENVPELGPEISVISSKGYAMISLWEHVGLKTTYRGIARPERLTKTRASEGWHSDITFEKVPSDYAVRGFLLNSNAIISPKYTDPQVTHTPSRYVPSSIFAIHQPPTPLLVGGDTLVWAQDDHRMHRIDSSFVSGPVVMKLMIDFPLHIRNSWKVWRLLMMEVFSMWWVISTTNQWLSKHDCSTAQKRVSK